MTLRIEVIDPYDGDRDEGQWSVSFDFMWFRAGRGVAGFRGFGFTLFRWTLLVGQEISFDE